MTIETCRLVKELGILRTSEEIEKEIEKKRELIKTHEQRIFKLKEEIQKLENTRSKAWHREDLANSDKFINVVKCESQKRIEGFGGSLSNFLITTEKGFTFLALKKWKLGKHKITEDWYKTISKPRCPQCNWQLSEFNGKSECHNPNCKDNKK